MNCLEVINSSTEMMTRSSAERVMSPRNGWLERHFEWFFDTKFVFHIFSSILVDRSVPFLLIFKNKYEFCYFMYLGFLADK